MKKCVICISKNADNFYINDWCEYYINIGFDHIFLFDNNEYDKKYDIFDKKNVSVLDYPSECGMQEESDKITNRIHSHRQGFVYMIGLAMAYDQGYDYCFICDDDELLDFNGRFNDVDDFLNKYSDYDTISIRWKNIFNLPYIYISDEPKGERLIDIYFNGDTIPHFNVKSFYKMKGKDVDRVFREIIGHDNIIHSINKENNIVFEDNYVFVRHNPTFCMERFLIKKVNYKSKHPWLINNYLSYFRHNNVLTKEKMIAFVELCKKYNIDIPNNDKKILDENNILY